MYANLDLHANFIWEASIVPHIWWCLVILKKTFHYCCNFATLGILMYLEYNLSLSANNLQTNLVYLIILVLPTPKSFPILWSLWPHANFAEYRYHSFMYWQCFSIIYICMLYVWCQNVTKFLTCPNVMQKSTYHLLLRSSTSCIYTLSYIASHHWIDIRNIHHFILGNMFLLNFSPINKYVIQNMNNIIASCDIASYWPIDSLYYFLLLIVVFWTTHTQNYCISDCLHWNHKEELLNNFVVLLHETIII